MTHAAADVIAAAAAAVRTDPAGDLALGRRELVYGALGDRAGRPGAPGPGWRRRAALALATCRHSLPIWERERPEDRLPHALLELVPPLLGPDADPAAARAAAGRLWGHAENMTQLLGPPARMWVGFACAKAVEVALGDEWFDPDDVDPARTELGLGLDVSGVDTAFLAASAHADGPPWSDDADPERRRAFWLWWLEQAARSARADPGADPGA